MLSLHQVHKITGLMGFWGINIQLTYRLSLMTLPRTILIHAGLPVSWLTMFYLMFFLTFLYQSGFYGLSFQLLTHNIFHHPTGSLGKPQFWLSPTNHPLPTPEQLTLSVQNHTALLTAFISVS